MSSDEPQTSGDEDEDPRDYRRGGYHPVKIGDRFSDDRYTVLAKLGWGHFSTVWLSWDKANSRAVALKIQKSAKRYAEAAKDEVKLLKQVAQSEARSGDHHVALLYDSFQHRGVNGLHHAMVFEVLGDNLLSLIKATKYKGLAMPLVRSVASAVLLALDHLHARLRIIHTDLKPENILCTLHPQQIQAMVDAARAQLDAPEAQGNATAEAMRKTMLDSSSGLFTDTVQGNHSAWHSQVFSLWAGVAPRENWPQMMTLLAGKAVGTGVTGSVYAAYAYFLSLYEADFDLDKIRDLLCEQ